MLNKCSNRSKDVQLSALEGNCNSQTHQPTFQPTNRQTDWPPRNKDNKKYVCLEDTVWMFTSTRFVCCDISGQNNIFKPSKIGQCLMNILYTNQRPCHRTPRRTQSVLAPRSMFYTNVQYKLSCPIIFLFRLALTGQGFWITKYVLVLCNI